MEFVFIVLGKQPHRWALFDWQSAPCLVLQRCCHHELQGKECFADSAIGVIECHDADWQPFGHDPAPCGHLEALEPWEVDGAPRLFGRPMPVGE